MMKTKFTPGPWFYEIHDWGIAISADKGKRVCDVERFDDANLINAAPDMYEALLKAREFIENGIEYGLIRMPDIDTPDSAHMTLPKILAALSRADREVDDE